MDKISQEDIFAQNFSALKMESTSFTTARQANESMQHDGYGSAQTLVAPGHPAHASGPPVGMPSAGSGSSTTIIHIPMNLSRKSVEEKERIMRGPTLWPDFVCPMVSKTHFSKHGPVLRLLTDSIKSVPNEVTSIRLEWLTEDMIPQFLYVNMASLRKWGVDKVKEYTHLNGYNVLDHPKLDVRHYMVKFTFSSLAPYVRDALGTHETGMWICHYPGLYQRLRGITHEDGTFEDIIFLNMHITLIPIHARTHVPEGGWSPYLTVEARPEGPAEKKAKQNPPPGRYKPSSRSQAEGKNLSEEVDNLKRTVDDMRRQAAIPVQYPQLPLSHVVPGGPTPCEGLVDDAPVCVVPQTQAGPTWVNPDSSLPKFV